MGVPPYQVQAGGRRDPQPGQIPGQGGRGYPHPGQILRWGDGEYPPSRSDHRMGGTPYWNSITCTCYAVGGMPLAFTQEDFLVMVIFFRKPRDNERKWAGGGGVGVSLAPH